MGYISLLIYLLTYLLTYLLGRFGSVSRKNVDFVYAIARPNFVDAHWLIPITVT